MSAQQEGVSSGAPGGADPGGPGGADHAARLRRLGEACMAAFPEGVTGMTVRDQGGFTDSLYLPVTADSLPDILAWLRDAPEGRCRQLMDISGVDWPGRTERIELCYQLLSIEKNLRVQVVVRTGCDTPVPTVTSVFPSADWLEREAFDMFGVLFTGHPDLRRILTDYGFDGHPLRKDFPLSGHVEVCYDDEQKRVASREVRLEQEYRNFDRESPWDGGALQDPGAAMNRPREPGR